jgi:uncharacterized protein YidB (DUF937 family)
MGVVDAVIGSVLARRGFGGPSSPLAMAMMALLASRAFGRKGGLLGGGVGGLMGLAALVDQFMRSGYGDIIKSWIAKGPNRPISTEQLGKAVGPDLIEQLAQKTGMGRDDLLAKLAECLPEVVDKLTPDGRLPTEQEAAILETGAPRHR